MRRVKGFTLIELLVVISVIALLMAVLMPALGRVKRMARAVVCQSNLRQWGVAYSMYTNENDGRFFAFRSDGDSTALWWSVMRPYVKDCNDLLLCPMAAKCKTDKAEFSSSGERISGSKFSAWGRRGVGWPRTYGSYGLNRYVNVLDNHSGSGYDGTSPGLHWYWGTTFVKGTNNIPVFFDCAQWEALIYREALPPDYDDMPNPLSASSGNMPTVCIDRHDAHINTLFMDWSVRKVGLKELWTLKWHRKYDTVNEWTKAGGVKPGDWPQWMRKFKDY